MRSRLSRAPRARISRRSFLKVAAACGLAGYARPARASRLSIGSSLPLPVPYSFQPNPDAVLRRSPAAFDLLLAPAYVVTELIARQALLPLAGPPGRAHDPDGACSVPYAFAFGALVYPAGQPPLQEAAAWPAETVWPAWPRLVVGAALLASGCSPNELDAGRLAQAAHALAGWHPRLALDPLAALAAGRIRLAYAPVMLSAGSEPQLPQAANCLLPPQGSPLIEYDWVIPVGSLAPDAARALVAELTPRPVAPPARPPIRLVPLAPLPDAARARHAALWASLTSAPQ